jgi:hypothetical protein
MAYFAEMIRGVIADGNRGQTGDRPFIRLFEGTTPRGGVPT